MGSGLTIGSLFSGIGGLELGLEACGLGPVLWQCDSDPYARAVLEAHWPGVRRYNDVREIDERAERPDIICGGFPCQDISNAGKQAGIDGPKSGLWSEFARIIRVLRPRFVFVENVAALLGRGLDRVLGDLAALGFDAEWETFFASEVGAPHRRDRLFLLAYADRSTWNKRSAFARGDGGSSGPERGWMPELDGHGSLVDANRSGCKGKERNESSEARRGYAAVSDSEAISDPNRSGRSEQWIGGLLDSERTAPGNHPYGRDRAHRFPPGPTWIAGWDGPQPAIRRGDDGVPGRSHRLRLLGNAVVPAQAAHAFKALSSRPTPEERSEPHGTTKEDR